MKKFLKFIVLIVFLSALSGALYLFYLSPSDNFQSVYLVPADAAFIIETGKPFDAWDKIVHNRVWDYMKTNILFAEINKDITRVDSMVNSNRLLLKMFGSRKILMSYHAYKPGKYDFLYVVDLKKASRLKSVKKYLDKVLNENFRLTRRDYQELEIFELFDKKSGENYYFSFVKNQLVFSQIPALIESSLDQLDELTLGRDMNFIEVNRRTDEKGLFSVCINYSYFKNYLSTVMGKPNDLVSNLAKNLFFTSLYFDLDESGQLKIEGYTSYRDTGLSVFYALTQSGSGLRDISEILPVRTASVTDIGFSDINKLFENFNQTLDESSRTLVGSSVEKMEKKLKIDLRKNFFGWIDDEMALIQTQPSNLGRQNEFAVVFKAKNKKDATENLYFLAEQLRKNSPVKFRELSYKDYTISYLHVPGIFRFLFGRLLERLEKPYFAVVDKWVIFSNHPQTIKSIIDDYEEEKTILKSDEKNTFTRLFPSRSLAFVYIQTPVLFGNMKEYVSPVTWYKMNENKKYIESFSDIGIHVEEEQNLLKLQIIARFNPSFEEYRPVNYLLSPDMFNFGDTLEQPVKLNYEPEIVIRDPDISKHREFYENGNLKLEVDLKKGLKNGAFKEFYENGTLKTKGKYSDDQMDGTWKYYDEAGELKQTREFEKGVLNE